MPSNTPFHRRARQVLLITVAGTLLLYLIPSGGYIAYPLVLLSTLAHEAGHGVAAMLVGADFQSLKVWADGSGVASWAGRVGRLGQAFVAAGGLVGPAVAAAVGFVLGRDPRHARTGLWIVAVALVILDLWVVRNLFGFAFVALLAVVLALVAARATPVWVQGATVFLAVQLALSVFSRGDYLFVAVARTGMGPMPSDVAQMAQALWLPYWFWGALCGLLSLTVVAGGLWGLTRSR
jgi:hypothetical protein